MDKNRRNKRNSNWNNQNRNGNQNRNQENNKKVFQFNHSAYEDENANREKQKAIQEIKERQLVCPKCGQVITEIASALTDKSTGQPIHFDCAMNEAGKNEKLGPNEKLAYIGQGRFGILYFENPRDQRHFTIKKIIEWEDRDQKSDWRSEISELYSKVN